GHVEVHPPPPRPLARGYRLPPDYVPVLVDLDDIRYRAFNGVEIVRAARWLPELVDAFRTGGAPPPLPWAPEGRAEYNRATFLNLLGTQWLPAIPDVDQRLRPHPPARRAPRGGGRPRGRGGRCAPREGAGLPPGEGRGFRPGPGGARRSPPQCRAGRRVRAGHLRRHRCLRPGHVRAVRPGDDPRRAP